MSSAGCVELRRCTIPKLPLFTEAKCRPKLVNKSWLD
jgi:hypothetical protein